VVETLKSKLKNTTKNFSDVLELRTETIKAQQKERENFTGTQSPAIGRRTAESPLYKSTVSNLDGEENSDVAITIPQTMLVSQERYINQRVEAVASIERTIIELRSIFLQLANLVVEQEGMIQRIDANVETTSANITTAQNELLKYLTNIGNNRWLIAKLFAVLFLFIIIFVVFFV